MEKYHIGQEILKEVKAKFPSVAAFARELCKSSSATYEIFGKTSLDTDLLLKVSKLLDRDFFREFSEKCLNGEVVVVDKQTAENSISLLLPEDKLHTVLPRQTMDVVEEFLLMPRKKPLVLFYSGARNRNLPRLVCKKSEEIYGNGMVRNMRLEPEELMHFELGVMSLAKMPQKVVVIKCTMARDYNSHVLIAERLAQESGKHVVLLCLDPIHIPTLPNGQVMLKSLALSTFNSWNQRAHIFIADDIEKRFAYLFELFHAIKGKGYMDRIYDSIEGNENWADTLKDLLCEAKQNLTTFEDIVLEESSDKDNRQVEYHQVSTIQPTINDLKRSEGISHIRTHLRYCKIKETGEIIEYEPMSFDQVKEMNTASYDGKENSDDVIDDSSLDPLFEEAARIIVITQSGFATVIQRHLSIGYNRAVRLMDQLEKAGIVGVAQENKSREVRVKDENCLENLLVTLR